ncbi:MAG: PBP1A family penicillin-binding protein [Patescibacteria group bacterium]
MFKKIKKLRKHRFFKNLLLLSVGAFIIIVSIIIIWLSSIKIPDFRSFEERRTMSSVKIYDRTGEILLYDISQDIRKTDISIEEMGNNIQNATIAIEDYSFYSHNGIKITSIIRAALSNILNVGKTQGGSTITQQLVKNTLLTPKKTLTRKIKEWVLALKIEKELTKQQILEAYLNESPYGGTLYGIEEASRTYFGKDPKDLTLAEASYLAAIPQAPTTLSPYGKNKDKLEERKNLVLFRMNELGYITKEEYDTAKIETVNFLPQSIGGIKAPHFVFFIKDYLEQKYGEEIIGNGGLKITTTLDYTLQQKGEKIVREGALQNEKDWNGSNAGLVAIDPKTGQILTMVGSRDYFDKLIDGNYNIATAHRQPGSSFKPFIYATAFNKGFTPDTVLFDLPTEFQSTCNAYGKALPGHSQADCYMPDNYDGKFRGPMSLRNGLAQSINIIAVKLFYLAGLQDSLNTAEEMGISTLTDLSRYGLTLVIGGGEVSLLDITSAYGVFANNGIRNPYTGILKIEKNNGEVLEEFSPKPREILPKNTTLILSDILSDNIARTPTFGANSVLKIPGQEVAVKTGTTNNNKDAWTVGYTPTISIGVWAGNNDNKPMKKGGASVAGPIWNKFITEALKVLPNEQFEKPNLETDTETLKPILRGFWQGNEHFFIDKISGKLATENTPTETIQEKVITEVHSILYWLDRDNILGNPPIDPTKNSQFSHWEIPIQTWWAQNRFNYPITTWDDMPIEIDNIHSETNPLSILILEPNTENSYPVDQKIQLKIQKTGPYELKKIDIFINGSYLGTSNFPFNFSFIPSELDNLENENQIRIIAYDLVYNQAEIISTFKITE